MLKEPPFDVQAASAKEENAALDEVARERECEVATRARELSSSARRVLDVQRGARLTRRSPLRPPAGTWRGRAPQTASRGSAREAPSEPPEGRCASVLADCPARQRSRGLFCPASEAAKCTW